MQGLLFIDKPSGWTSFDVVAFVRKMIARIEGKKPKHVKVGHTGTLDPAATGLLILCIGKATKRVPDLIKKDKIYEVELTLGFISTTADQEGDISLVSSEVPSKSQVEEIMQKFVGNIEQTPPAFSAIKVNGKRAYELARAGKPVNLKPRLVTIYSIENLSYEYPKVCFTTRVSSGTYIRSLATDVGEALGVGAYMSQLRRTGIGDVILNQAYELSALTDDILQKTLVEK